MKNYQQSIGTPIREHGKLAILTSISDIIFDTEKGLLKAVLTKTNHIVLFSEILKWDQSIWISSEVFIRNIEESKQIQAILDREISILGNHIIDEDGISYGYCEDFSFDEKTGMLLNVLSKKDLLGLIPLKKFLIDASGIIEITTKRILIKSGKIRNAVPDAQ